MDKEANNREINELINESKAGHIDLTVVGSETLLGNDLSEDQLFNFSLPSLFNPQNEEK